MSELSGLGRFVISEVVHLAPWFLVAIVLGIAVQKLSIDVVARRSFARRGVLGIAVVTAIGAFSPFCSFTVIPLIRRFLIAGIPLSVVMAFWVASPSMDPEIYALSVSQLGFPIATARLVGALVLSFGAGLVVLALERRGWFSLPLRGNVDAAPIPSCSAAPAPEPTCSVAVPAQAQAPVAAGLSSASSGIGAGAAELPGEALSACSSATTQTAADPIADDGTPWRVLVRRDLKALRLRPILKEIWGDSLALGKWLLLAIVLEAVIVRYVPADV